MHTLIKYDIYTAIITYMYMQNLLREMVQEHLDSHHYQEDNYLPHQWWVRYLQVDIQYPLNVKYNPVLGGPRGKISL